MPFPTFGRFRKGTSSNFTAKSRRSEMPEPEHEDRTPEVKKDKKEDKKTDVNEGEDEDKKVQKDVGRNPKADGAEGEDRETGAKKTKDNERSGKTKTTMKSGNENVYSLFWDNLLSYNLQPKEYSRIASYLPNSMALEQILLQCTPIVGRSKYIQKHEPTYNEEAVVIYYFIIYYIQILRAKGAASNLDGIESNLLTRLSKSHPEETLDIAEPLFPYFNSIISTELEDRKYSWVCPDYKVGGSEFGFPETGAGATRVEAGSLVTFEIRHARDYVLPQIPLMLANLATFGSMSEADVNARMTDENVFMPYGVTRSATTPLFNRAGNNRIDFTDATNATDEHSQTVMAAGIRFPFRFFNDNWNEARRRIAETDFFGPNGVDFRLVNNTYDVGVTTWKAGTGGNTIEYFLNMPKTKNMRWFSYLKEQNAIFCKMWKNKYNLSDVNVTGGLETGVIVHLRTESNHTNGRLFNDNALGKAHNSEIKWYENPFAKMTAHVHTTRAGVNRKEELQALAFAINSIPPIYGLTTTHFREGQFFTHGDASREATTSQTIGDPDSTGPGPIDMFAGWTTNVAQRCFDKTGGV